MGALGSGFRWDLCGFGCEGWALGPDILGAQAEAEQEEGKEGEGLPVHLLTTKRTLVRALFGGR